MRRLYFDTETTGTIPKIVPSLPHCPHIVQLAALLVDAEGKDLMSMNAIIKPEEWQIPVEASNVHGITTTTAIECGLSGKTVMAFFSQMLRKADQVVAHNFAFDNQMVGFEMQRLDAPNVIAEKAWYCTMLGSKNIVKIPGLYQDFKWPKLMESYKHFFNEEFDGAHDALADLRACQRIHRQLIAIGETE